MATENNVTDIEAQIRADADAWVVTRGCGKNMLHLPNEESDDSHGESSAQSASQADDSEDVEPACLERSSLTGVNAFNSDRAIEWERKDLAVYPPGYAEVCSYCKEIWRNSDTDL
jgi:hypothetical protein